MIIEKIEAPTSAMNVEEYTKWLGDVHAEETAILDEKFEQDDEDFDGIDYDLPFEDDEN